MLLATSHMSQDNERQDKPDSTVLLGAIWTNNLKLIDHLLETGLRLDCQDSENSWTGLHRALYWGHLRAAAKLLQHGAFTSIQDSKGRTALDLLSVELKRYLPNCATGDVYSWGNGANYQLGTGSTGVSTNPVRIDSLHEVGVVQLAAGKFHTVALTSNGKVYTWGWGRGGRLGHPEFHIHSGETAVIVPRPVEGLGRRQVSMVSAAKHHTVVATVSGEVWTWGSNREGRLGYPAVDTQPTPRRVGNLKQFVVKVAAANKHTVVATSSGSVYSWGSNLEGQLGYGTSDSTCNPTPRLVEAMKGKAVRDVSAAKRHTVVMTDEGEVYTWGHKTVTPRRVNLSGARDLKRSASVDAASFKLHKGHSDVLRPVAVAIAAGVARSSCLTSIGVVLSWCSADPALAVHEVGGALAGKKALSIAAGKTRTAVVTDEGDLYVWDSPVDSSDPSAAARRAAKAVMGSSPPSRDAGDSFPEAHARSLEKSGSSGLLRRNMPYYPLDLVNPQRIDGLKRVGLVAVGEKHSCALQTWCRGKISSSCSSSAGQVSGQVSISVSGDGSEGTALGALAHMDPDSVLGDIEIDDDDLAGHMSTLALDEEHLLDSPSCSVPTLQLMCEKEVEQQVDPRNVLQLMEYSDVLGAAQLRRHCLAVAVSNLDAVILEGRTMFESLSPHLLAELEHLYKSLFLKQTGTCCKAGAGFGEGLVEGLRPTAAPVADGDDGADQDESAWCHPQVQLPDSSPTTPLPGSAGEAGRMTSRRFSDSKVAEECSEVQKLLRNLKKKLQQIDNLEKRRAEGSQLDPQQQLKVAQKPLLRDSVEALEGGAAAQEVLALMSSIREQADTVEQQGGAKRTDDAQQLSKSSRKSPRKSKNKSKSSTVDSLTTSSSMVRPSSAATLSAQVMPQPDSDTEDTASSTFNPASSAPSSSAPSRNNTSSAASQPALLPPSTEPVASSAVPSASSTLGAEVSDWDRLARPTLQVGDGASLKSKSLKKKGAVRKGGLSMFLSGELEKAPEPPVVTKRAPEPAGSGGTVSNKPAWGAAAVGSSGASSMSSLKAIQEQEASAVQTPEPKPRVARSGQQPAGMPTPKAERVGAALGSCDALQVSLAQLVKQSSPIAVKKKKEKPPPSPAWGGVSGTSPLSGQASFREIQAQQEHSRENVARSWGASPVRSAPVPPAAQWRPHNTNVPGSSPGGSFPLGSSPTSTTRIGTPQAASHNSSKWYVPDQPATQHIRSIQTEQTAINQLAKLYGVGNVKVVTKR